MNVVIIEDEILAAEKIEDFLLRYYPSVKIIAILDSIKSCINWFDNHSLPDLVFSDIELLDGNVFKIFDTINITCPIIFTTSYDQYLMEAFKVNSIAYLLKPFDYERFEQAMNKYKQLQANFSTLTPSFIEKLKKFVAEDKTYKKRFAVKTAKGIYIINTSEISYIQVINGLVQAYLNTGKKYSLNYSLGQLEELLDPAVFFRINRSEMINIEFLEKLEPYFNDRLSISLKGMNEKLITSTSRTPSLRKWIDK